MEGIFFKKNSEYDNQLNPVKGYYQQLATFIAGKKGCDITEAAAIAKQIINKHFKDRPIKYFERNEVGDRTVEDGTVLKYIQSNIAQKNILVPTFTSYMNANVKKSILSEFIAVNVATRAKAKKEGQKAKAAGLKDVAESKNNEQNNMKIRNNSVSGLFGQSACILHNPTAHSTLTSITRTMTSLSNACNERLIAGNRYLPRPIDVFHAVVYESTYVNINHIKEVIEKYNLYLPTVKDVVSVLKYSSDLYFRDDGYYEKYIVPYLSKLSPYQLAGICYTGDLYHLRRFNDEFMRKLMGQLTLKIVSDKGKLEDFTPVYKVHEPILNFVHSIFYSDIRGMGKDYEKMNEVGLVSSILETSDNVVNVVRNYGDFFRTFFMTEIVPINSHRLYNMRRRVVVLSDTDSSCFTLDEWVEWSKGEYMVTDETIALASCITYIASEAIVNQLAILSKSMNVQDELLDVLAMKNEFLWLSITPAPVSKHYFAWTAIQEGNVHKEGEMELKGVHLKNSAVPVEAVSHGIKLMENICHSIADNKKVSLNHYLSEVIGMENRIIESVTKGETIYLKRSKIKDHTAYAQEAGKSPYQRHLFWEDVFSEKYGRIQPPPYDVVKLPTTITSKTAVLKWLESIEDIELRSRLMKWMQDYSKKDLPTIYLNGDFVKGNGLPVEIASVIDIKRIVFDNTMQHRIILETLGVLLNEELLVREQFKV